MKINCISLDMFFFVSFLFSGRNQDGSPQDCFYFGGHDHFSRLVYSKVINSSQKGSWMKIANYDTHKGKVMSEPFQN